MLSGWVPASHTTLPQHRDLDAEEVVRYDGRVQFLPWRTALDDLDVAGVTIPRGAPITLILAAGNRDPEHVPDPDVFDPDRWPVLHLGFGDGIHYCFGAPSRGWRRSSRCPPSPRSWHRRRWRRIPRRTATVPSCAAPGTSACAAVSRGLMIRDQPGTAQGLGTPAPGQVPARRGHEFPVRPVQRKVTQDEHPLWRVVMSLGMASELPAGDRRQVRPPLTASTWDAMAVRADVARWAVDTIDPIAYVIDDSGFPTGAASPGAPRARALTGSSLTGVSVQLATDIASVAADWRLFCPASWDDRTISDPPEAAAVRGRRTRAGIGGDVRYREQWRLVLDMLDEMIQGWRLPKLPVAAGCGYGDRIPFRRGLRERDLRYTVEVDPDRPGVPDPVATFKETVVDAGQDATQQVTWRQCDRRTAGNPTTLLHSRFLRLQSRPAGCDDNGTLPEEWLIAEWPPGVDEPVRYWLSDLDSRTSLRSVVRLAMLCRRVEPAARARGDAGHARTAS
ncbi:cytochrome P450 [Dactylosporangium sp. NPDC049525]|uniref:cytochrome P450 n=1 Tax=Dactylosporangium sp. NPDC049525 TaxID=3154730 RepID=UPI00342075D5